MTRVAIYTRLSSDTTGQQTATQRQEAACRKYADLREWVVGEVFEDVDLSAYAKSVVRPAYERLVKCVHGGGYDGVLVWKLDRLVRRPAEFERFWEVCDSHGVFLTSAVEPIDSSTDLGLALVRILVAFASLESATTSARLKAKARDSAERGLAQGPRAYGHQVGMKAVVPTEARAIRLMAHELVRGQSLIAVVRELERRRIRTYTGQARWSTTTISGLLREHRLVGDRTYRGEIVAENCFAPILDRKTWDTLQDRLAKIRGAPRRRNVPYLLNDFLFCGRCGSRMLGRQRQEHGSDRHAYICRRKSASDCPGVTIAQMQTDAWVTDVVLWRIAQRSGREPPENGSFEQLTMEKRQELLSAELVRAVVLPQVGLRGTRFDSRRIQPVWSRPLSHPEGEVPLARRPVNEHQPTASSRPRFGELNTTEAAVVLGGISSSLVCKLIREGGLRAHMIEGSYWLSHRDIARFLAHARVGPQGIRRPPGKRPANG